MNLKQMFELLKLIDEVVNENKEIVDYGFSKNMIYVETTKTTHYFYVEIEK